jgi:hypothetical protein
MMINNWDDRCQLRYEANNTRSSTAEQAILAEQKRKGAEKRYPTGCAGLDIVFRWMSARPMAPRSTGMAPRGAGKESSSPGAALVVPNYGMNMSNVWLMPVRDGRTNRLRRVGYRFSVDERSTHGSAFSGDDSYWEVWHFPVGWSGD